MKKVDIGEEYNGIKLGQQCKFKGDTELKIKPFFTRIVGVDLDSFKVGLNYIMIEYERGADVKGSKFSNLDIVYCVDTKFMWVTLEDIERSVI